MATDTAVDRRDRAGVLAPGFVCRDAELAAAARALGHHPALVLIEGEPGIGKSRLVQELLASPAGRTRGAVVASCPPLRRPFPLGPVVEALRATGDRLPSLRLSPLAGALRPMFPEWVADLPPPCEPLEDPRAVRHRLLRAVAELIDQLGVDLLVIEDVHWADEATLELLLMLQTRPAGRPVSLVLTFRPEEVAPHSTLRQLTGRPPAGTAHARVALGPLTKTGTRQLVASMLTTDEISEEFVALLHQRTAGVPLAVEESVLLLADRRDVFRRDGEWARRTIDRLQVPASVRDSVLERVSRLAPAAHRILEAAAVLGEPAHRSVLAPVAGLDETAAGRGIADGMAAGLLYETGPGLVAFRHALPQGAVYQAIPAPQRRQLHERAARCLETVTPPAVVELARHFRQAHDLAGWAGYAEAAADLAAESGDDRTVVALLHDLLVEADHPADVHARLARKLAQAANVGLVAHDDRSERVMETIRTAIARADLAAGDRGQLRVLLSRLLVQQGQLTAAYREIERAVPDLRDNRALAAKAMIGLSWPWLGGRPVPEHRAWLDRAAALLTALPDGPEKVAVLADHATALLMLGDPAGLPAVADLPTRAGTLTEQRDLARGYANAGQAAEAWGHYRLARTCIDTAANLVDPAKDLVVHGAVQRARAYLDYCTGEWSSLRAVAAELAAADGTTAIGMGGAQLIEGLLALAAGETGAAERALRRVVAAFGDVGLADDALTAAAALARLRLAVGDVEGALAATEPGMGTIAATGNWLWATDIVRVHVDALVAHGAVAPARALVRQLAAWLAGRDTPAPAAALASCRASLAAGTGQPRRAAERFDQVARAWRALPRPYDALLATERQGHCLLAAGEHRAALELLGDCQQQLLDLGARWDADRVAQLLRDHDVEVARPWRGGRRGYGDELSPRERDVVRLVAGGLTNRQVAEALFISPRTVADHVSGAMRKLGVTSRTALAAATVRAGVPPPETGGGQAER